MASQKSARSSAARPKDRPTKRRERTARSAASSGRRDRSTARVGAGRSPLNPGFPKWAVWSAVALVLVLAGGWVIFSSTLFGVRDVEVSGAKVVAVQQVREAVALGPDDSLAAVNLADVTKRVEALPPVAKATVTRSWPGTLQVQITERTPVATVQVDGAPWAIDAEGMPYVEATALGKDSAALLPLEVAAPSPDDLATREAVTVITGLDDKAREIVDRVTATSAAQVTLVLKDGRQVIWGDSSKMNDKLTMLAGVLEHPGSIFDISSPTAIVIK